MKTLCADGSFACCNARVGHRQGPYQREPREPQGSRGFSFVACSWPQPRIALYLAGDFHQRCGTGKGLRQQRVPLVCVAVADLGLHAELHRPGLARRTGAARNLELWSDRYAVRFFGGASVRTVLRVDGHSDRAGRRSLQSRRYHRAVHRAVVADDGALRFCDGLRVFADRSYRRGGRRSGKQSSIELGTRRLLSS